MDTQVLAIWLYEQPGEMIPPMGDAIDGWNPRPSHCHENVAEWLTFHPEDRAVRGWLDISFLALRNRRRYGPHSIIQRSTGELIDVTLRESDGCYRFIRHPGDEAEFLAAVTDNRVPWVEHILWPDDPDLMGYMPG